MNLEKSGNNNNGNSFYFAVPIIKAINGKCIENGKRPQKTEILYVESERITLSSSKPEVKDTQITKGSFFEPIYLGLEVIQIKLMKGNKKKPSLKLIFQIKNFAIQKHKWYEWIGGLKKFDILWYFGFLSKANNHERTAKVEIEHPKRGHLKTDDIIISSNKIGSAQHGRKFICGIHVNASQNGNGESYMKCKFKYSYMPEWAIIFIGIFPYAFIGILFTIF